MAKKTIDKKVGGWRDPAAERVYTNKITRYLKEPVLNMPDLGDLISEMVVLQISNPKIIDKKYRGKDKNRYTEIRLLINKIGYDAERIQYPERFTG